MNFPWTGELHRRAGRQAALQDRPVGCILRQAGGLYIKLGCRNGRARGLPFSAVRLAIFRSPPDRLFVQAAGLPFCLLCSLSKVNVFQETRPSSPPGPPISVIPKSVWYLSKCWKRNMKRNSPVVEVTSLPLFTLLHVKTKNWNRLNFTLEDDIRCALSTM